MRPLPTPNRDDVNLRNRMCHSGLFGIEEKRFEIVNSLGGLCTPPLPIMAGADPFAPGNICGLCLEVLEGIDSEFFSGTTPNAKDLAWTEHLSLSPDELEFSRQLTCDFLRTSEEADALRAQLVNFNRAIMPVMSQWFNISFHGWIRPFERKDALLQLMTFGLAFEGIYRLVLHLVGESILQVDTKNARVQYRILDFQDIGMCSDRIITRLAVGLPPEAKPLAFRTLKLAVKARNALAHGVVPMADEDVYLAIGHLFIKSIELVIVAGYRHMISEGAYYKWTTHRNRQHGYDVRDWIDAETETIRLVAKTANRKETGRGHA